MGESAEDGYGWLFAIVGVYVLVHGWFADMSLDDEEARTRGGDAR